MTGSTQRTGTAASITSEFRRVQVDDDELHASRRYKALGEHHTEAECDELVSRLRATLEDFLDDLRTNG